MLKSDKMAGQYLEEMRLDEDRKIFILRHDKVDGGTKAIVLPQVMAGYNEQKGFTYGSPSFGYAQYAIAVVCREFGLESHIFIPKRRQLTNISLAAEKIGATLHQVDPGYLVVVQKRAKDYASANGLSLLPFGLDCETMTSALVGLAKNLLFTPSEVWVTANSGTLWRALVSAWPGQKFCVVAGGKKQDLSWTSQFPDMKFNIFEPPEKFEQKARKPPPFPSAEHYDAKIWQFLDRYARRNALVWNVAGGLDAILREDD